MKLSTKKGLSYTAIAAGAAILTGIFVYLSLPVFQNIIFANLSLVLTITLFFMGLGLLAVGLYFAIKGNSNQRNSKKITPPFDNSLLLPEKARKFISEHKNQKKRNETLVVNLIHEQLQKFNVLPTNEKTVHLEDKHWEVVRNYISTICEIIGNDIDLFNKEINIKNYGSIPVLLLEIENLKAHLKAVDNPGSRNMYDQFTKLEETINKNLTLKQRSIWVKLQTFHNRHPEARKALSSAVYRSANAPNDTTTQHWFSDEAALHYIIKRVEEQLEKKQNKTNEELLRSVLQRNQSKLEKVIKGYKVRLPHFYHATKPNTFQIIIDSGEIQVRHKGVFKGAFVSTRPELGFGEYIFAFAARDIERLSELENGFPTGSAYWAGFSKGIPVYDQNFHTPDASNKKEKSMHKHASKLCYLIVQDSSKIDATRKILSNKGYQNIEVVSLDESEIERQLLAEFVGKAVVPTEWFSIGPHKNGIKVANVTAVQRLAQMQPKLRLALALRVVEGEVKRVEEVEVEVEEALLQQPRLQYGCQQRISTNTQPQYGHQQHRQQLFALQEVEEEMEEALVQQPRLQYGYQQHRQRRQLLLA